MQQIGFFVLISLPLGLVFLYFHAQYWHLLLIFMILLLLVQTASVLGKYAFFTPNEELKSVAVFNYLLLVCLVVPFFAPMPIIMIFYFYRKAKKNLKTYL
jgi:predicted membrane channel-forming protein YqfA (hemolysin III family)